jgi:hypothetical protein
MTEAAKSFNHKALLDSQYMILHPLTNCFLNPYRIVSVICDPSPKGLCKGANSLSRISDARYFLSMPRTLLTWPCRAAKREIPLTDLHVMLNLWL